MTVEEALAKLQNELLDIKIEQATIRIILEGRDGRNGIKGNVNQIKKTVINHDRAIQRAYGIAAALGAMAGALVSAAVGVLV